MERGIRMFDLIWYPRQDLATTVAASYRSLRSLTSLAKSDFLSDLPFQMLPKVAFETAAQRAQSALSFQVLLFEAETNK